MNTKKFIQILAVSATALITACEEQLTSFEGATPITVSTLVSEKTRAGYDNANLPSTFIMDIEQGSENYDYSLVTMTRGNGNTYNAPANMLLLWKGTETNHPSANVKAMTIPYGLSAIDANNAMTVKVHTDQTTDANVKASDLLGAKSGDGISISGDNINIEFRHLLSKLYVNYEFVKALGDQNPVVNSVTLKNVCVQGRYSYKDMNYVSDSRASGDIQMHLNTSKKAAEAIFYPHSPASDMCIEVNFSINGKPRTLSCPVKLNGRFNGGKQYNMIVRINGTTIDNSSITGVKDWIEDNESIEVAAGKKILWIGTSIATDEDPTWAKSYPRLIEEATGYKIVNNARAASYICFNPNSTWSVEPFSFNITEAYCLTSSHEEVEKKYRKIAGDIISYCNQVGVPLGGDTDYYMNLFKSYSYETLILPYINGTLDNCNVVVIDHGFNDRAWIQIEAYLGGHRPIDNTGAAWIQSVIDNPKTYALDPWFKNFASGQEKMSYFMGMKHLIDEIWNVNENIQIIIGNYFATRTPYFQAEFENGLSQGVHWGEELVLANEAVAAIHGLPVVNLYKELGFNEENAQKYELYNTLCPDGVHPGTDPNGTLNKKIADIYIRELKKIFGE